jgi:hypothetical protein
VKNFALPDESMGLSSFVLRQARASDLERIRIGADLLDGSSGRVDRFGPQFHLRVCGSERPERIRVALPGQADRVLASRDRFATVAQCSIGIG